jgi:hypothetical protein
MDIWMSIWADSTDMAEAMMQQLNTKFYLGIYLGFGALSIVFTIVRFLLLELGVWKAAKALHSNLLEKVRSV